MLAPPTVFDCLCPCLLRKEQNVVAYISVPSLPTMHDHVSIVLRFTVLYYILVNCEKQNATRNSLCQ